MLVRVQHYPNRRYVACLHLRGKITLLQDFISTETDLDINGPVITSLRPSNVMFYQADNREFVIMPLNNEYLGIMPPQQSAHLNFATGRDANLVFIVGYGF